MKFFLINILIFTFLMWGGAENTLFCKTIPRVGILPFQVYSGEKVDYLKDIIPTRLVRQLKEEDQLNIVNQDAIQKLMDEKGEKGVALKELDRIARKTGAHFLVYGSFTKIDDNLSIDARVFTTLKKSPPYKDFVEGKDLDRLIEKLGNKISKHILRVARQVTPPEITEEELPEISLAPSVTQPVTPEKVFELESKSPSLMESSMELDEESSIKAKPSFSGPAPLTPDTPPEVPEIDTGPEKKSPKPKSRLSYQPINITSDRMEADNRNRTVSFFGNVVAKREDMVIFSDRISTFYTKPGQIKKIIARGNVKINQHDRIATCQEATFFQPSLIFLNEDKIDIEGGKQNRVNAIIYPMGKNFE
ncbi:MAG: hypothetical protein JRJ08_03870 [Deltaproteobacteria bacterium]|nr:hypothetical protein [Deltaproteobacteria bacterium]